MTEKVCGRKFVDDAKTEDPMSRWSLSWLWRFAFRHGRTNLLVLFVLMFLVFAIWSLRSKSDTPEMVFV